MTSNFAARNSWERDGRISDSTRLAPSGNADAPPELSSTDPSTGSVIDRDWGRS
jgi:hypothetical protein